MSFPTTLKSVAATHIGKVKDQNEDTFFQDPSLGLFIVADGMGGHAAGEIAARMAIDAIPRALGPQIEGFRETAAVDSASNRQTVLKALEDAVRLADQEIYAAAESDPEKSGMHTTVDALLVLPGEAFIAHIGDSRVYLIRGGRPHLLTTDHSLGNYLRARGEHTDEEIAQLAQRHQIVRALGMAGGVDIDLINLDLVAGDRFLLCTDGLHCYTDEEGQVQSLVEQAVANWSAAPFIDFANDQGGKDNITALLVGVEQPGMIRKTVETTMKVALLQKAPMFRNLSAQEILSFLRLTEEFYLPAGEVVVREGQAGERLFVLLEGGVDIDANGIPITSLGPGSQFGELALVDDRPRSATVVTNVPSRLLAIRRDDFISLTRGGPLAPKLLWNLIHDISDRLRMTSWQLTEQARAFADTQDK